MNLYTSTKVKEPSLLPFSQRINDIYYHHVENFGKPPKAFYLTPDELCRLKNEILAFSWNSYSFPATGDKNYYMGVEVVVL